MDIKQACVDAIQTARNHGFYQKPFTISGATWDLDLIATEINEAIEALGKGDTMSNRMNHLEETQCDISSMTDTEKFEVLQHNTLEDELADIVIRVFSFCGAYGIDLEKAIIGKMEFNKTRPYLHGKKLAKKAN